MSVRLPEPPIPTRWLLDANVIFSEWSRLFCVEMAQRHSATLFFTPLIEEEAFRNLLRLGRVSELDAARQRQQLAEVLGAKILHTDCSPYLADVKFVDAKDQPIAATALQMHHEFQSDIGLITWNVKDFPRKQLLKKRVVRYTPDELAVALCKLQGVSASELLEATLQRLKNHFDAHSLLEPTSYALKAKPLPTDFESWQDFLKRNRLNNLAKLYERQQNADC